MPHKTALSFSGVWKVLGLLLLACPFFELAAAMTLALYSAASPNQMGGTQCVVFVIACFLCWTVGAWFGGNLALTKRNVRLAACWGCLLMLPFTWSYWAFIHRPSDAALGFGISPAYPTDTTAAGYDAAYAAAVKANNAPPTWAWVTLAGLNDYYWQAVATGCVGSFGMGMLSTAALAYVTMTYQCAEKSYVGKVLAIYAFGCVLLGPVVQMVLKYTYLNSSNSPVLGGILPVVAALGWHYASPVEKEGQQRRFCEAHSFWDQLQRFLNMLAPLSACMAFGQFGVAQVIATKQLDVSQINCCVGLSAGVAGAIFFGWGFDAVRARALQVWNFMAVLTLVLCLCTTMGALTNLVVLVSVLCTVVSAGGYVFYMAHMVYESDCCVLSTAAAFNVLSGLAMLLTSFVMAFFQDDSMYLCWAYLLITTGLSLALNVNGLPHRREMRME